MDLRFVPFPPESEIDVVEDICACSWCGFESKGHRRYVEEDGRKVEACDVCFSARHVADADKDMFCLIWSEEMSQQEVAHFSRVAAACIKFFPGRVGKTPKENKTINKYVYGKYYENKVQEDAKEVDDIIEILKSIENTEDYMESIKNMKENSYNIFKSLRERKIEETINGMMGLRIKEDWKFIEKEIQDNLIKGLRLLPVAFDEDEILFWIEEGATMSRYNPTQAFINNWHVDHIGLEIKSDEDPSETPASTSEKSAS